MRQRQICAVAAMAAMAMRQRAKQTLLLKVYSWQSHFPQDDEEEEEEEALSTRRRLEGAVGFPLLRFEGASFSPRPSDAMNWRKSTRQD